MVARMRGSRKTPERVVQLLQEEVDKSSQAATARATGLTLRGVQNYLKGIGEPTTATLEKLAGYFEVSIQELRGEAAFDADAISKCLNAITNMVTILHSKTGPQDELYQILEEVKRIGEIAVSTQHNLISDAKEKTTILEEYLNLLENKKKQLEKEKILLINKKSASDQPAS